MHLWDLMSSPSSSSSSSPSKLSSTHFCLLPFATRGRAPLPPPHGHSLENLLTTLLSKVALPEFLFLCGGGLGLPYKGLEEEGLELLLLLLLPLLAAQALVPLVSSSFPTSFSSSPSSSLSLSQPWTCSQKQAWQCSQQRELSNKERRDCSH